MRAEIRGPGCRLAPYTRQIKRGTAKWVCWGNDSTYTYHLVPVSLDFARSLLDLPPLFRSPSARFAPIPAIVVRHEEQAGRGSGAEIDPWRRGGCGRGGSPLVARSGESLVRQAAA